MSFLYPAFLYALSIVAIPIIIHLFNFRRYKTVYFTNVKFLKEIKEETAVQSRLKHWLVLFSRILAIIFLVLAFAQPVIPIKDSAAAKSGKRGISIYIDNSFSMNAETGEEPLLNRAKSKAIEIAGAYGEDDRFQLLTNEFSASQQRFVSKEEFLGMVDDVRLTSQVRTLQELQRLGGRDFKEASIDNRISYWISDFQKNIVDFKVDTTTALSLIPLQPLQQQNVYVDSCWLNKPIVYLDQPNKLLVKIVNTGDKEVKGSRLSLSINGQVKAISDFSVSSTSYTIDTLSFSVQNAGWKEVNVSITDYPVTFDDDYYLTFKVTDQVNVLAINDEKESDYLKALYENAEKFVFQNQYVNQLDYAGLRNFSLIILNNLIDIPSGLAHELSEYIKSGGVIVIFPNPKASIITYNKFLSSMDVATLVGIEDQEQAITYLNTEHEIFQDVFENIPENISLPTTSLYFKLSRKVNSSEQKLLGLRNGSNFISVYEYERGKIFLCISPLNVDYSNFPVHAIFVPMLYKMALSGGSTSKNAYTLGEDEIITLRNKLDHVDEIYKMRGPESEFIPQQKAIGANVQITIGEEVSQAGIYEIYTEGDDDMDLVALNYDRTESELDYYDDDELKEMYGDDINIISAVQGNITSYVKELDKGIVLWKLCIIFTLIFIGAEVLLLRFLP